MKGMWLHRRALPLLLVLALCLALLSGSALAAREEFTIEDGVLKSYNGPGGNVSIPEGVTEIAMWAFRGNKTVASVTIPDSVVEIGTMAFYECSNLVRADLPKDLQILGSSAFAKCSSLASVIIPDGVSTISPEAFSGCGSLTSLTVPGSVITIGDGAFSGCGLSRVALPEGVVTVGSAAFSNCTKLVSCDFPDSVASIGDSAFSGCTSLTSVFLPRGLPTISAGMFSGCSALTTLVIPDSVASIEDSAFSGCSALSRLTIPDGVASIGDGAFCGCKALRELSLPNTLASFGTTGQVMNGTFADSGLTSFTIPDGVASIPARAFMDCYDLESITIPASVTSVGREAFHWCESLKTVCYAGSREEWERIVIADGFNYGGYRPNGNDALKNATVYFNGERPASRPEVEAIPRTGVAAASDWDIDVNGRLVHFDAYILYNEEGNGTNYVKLRDIAFVLNGSGAQFNVSWNADEGKIEITTHAPYTSPNGSEMFAPFSGDQPYRRADTPVLIDGEEVALTAFTITGSNGGYTYFKLRDLAEVLGFTADWEPERGAFIETN